ncbi:MAG: triosephosphate isomerase [Acidimicrobiales bacterium]|jgi:triosephosphate isomerase (TIM)
MSDRKPLISGNWKMNLNHFEALKLVQELSYQVSNDDIDAVDVSLHPPFTDIRTVQTVLEADRLPFHLGAQHCYHEDSGAFTGEVSAAMLTKLNVSYVLAGHSERREVFGESDETVNLKVKAILKYGMVPIMCCGETLEEREAEEAEAKVGGQIVAGLSGLSPEQVGSMVIAYEPIWAIGTGRTASAEDAQNMCQFVRSTVADQFGADAAAAVRIQYGGSVNPSNAPELLSQPDIDGALVGGACLEAESFGRVIQYRLAD